MLSIAPNFRDLGGWTTIDGNRVARGMIFRSEALLAPTREDAEFLARLSIKLICDLRSETERTAAPNAFWSRHGVDRIELDLLAGIPTAGGPWEALGESPDAEGAEEAMRRVYTSMPTAALTHVGELFGRIGQGDLPLLVHCTAGKDRTGFISALLLDALGVPWAEVLKDYLNSLGRRTEQAAEATREMVLARAGRSLTPTALDAMLGVRAEYLEASFDRIRTTYGGTSAYLERAGVDAELLRRVRGRLLD